MKPYYEADGVVIYHGDCRAIVPTLDLQPATTLVVADPPYGVAERTDRKSKGRGKLTESNDFPPVYGDDEPFDPAWLLSWPRLVLWGANYYAPALPPSSAWIVWDKLAGLRSAREVGFNDNADVEVAWTSLGGPARLYAHRWTGAMKGSERENGRVHPTQKPVALYSWLLKWRAKPGDMVLDPYLGGGASLVAARALGHKAIGIEIEERYCEVAAKRLSQRVLDFGGEAA